MFNERVGYQGIIIIWISLLTYANEVRNVNLIIYYENLYLEFDMFRTTFANLWT